MALSIAGGVASQGAEAAPKVYVKVRGARVGTHKQCGLTEDRVRKVFTDALKARSEVTFDETPGVDGYGSLLRLTKCSHEVLPPPKGKVYRVLMVEVDVAIDAEKIPSGQMALAGEGSSQVGTEISRVKDKERLQLLDEALVAATKQAVDRSIAKLTTPSTTKTSKGKARGRRKARRRR